MLINAVGLAFKKGPRRGPDRGREVSGVAQTLGAGAWVHEASGKTTREEGKDWKSERKKPRLTFVLIMQFKRTGAMLWRPNVP